MFPTVQGRLKHGLRGDHASPLLEEQSAPNLDRGAYSVSTRAQRSACCPDHSSDPSGSRVTSASGISLSAPPSGGTFPVNETTLLLSKPWSSRACATVTRLNRVP